MFDEDNITQENAIKSIAIFLLLAVSAFMAYKIIKRKNVIK